MKRLSRWLMVVVALAALLAPVSLQWSPSSAPQIRVATALAADCVTGKNGQCCPGKAVPDTAGECPDKDFLKKAIASNGGDCREGTVEIALPLLSTTGKCLNNTGPGGAVMVYIVELLKLANKLVGVVIIFLVTWAGFDLVTSLGDPGRIKSGRDRLQRAIIALVLYLSMFAILTFLVPGGIL